MMQMDKFVAMVVISVYTIIILQFASLNEVQLMFSSYEVILYLLS